MQMPSMDVYNDTIDRLLQSLKYIKFNELVFKLILKALEPLEKFMKRLFANSQTINGDIASAKIILVVIVAFIVLLMICLIVFLLIRRRKKRRVKTILGEKIYKDSTVAEFLEKSKGYEEQGAYRNAVRLRFIAVLFFLHQNHYLYHDSTMTGKEMVDKLKRDRFFGADSFEGITQKFNTIWYGMNEIDEEIYKSWSEKETIFWQEVQ